MNHNLSDQEQVQMLKNLWKKYGTSLLAGICIFLAASYGWRYWNNYKVHNAEIASVTYTEMLAKYETGKIDQASLIADHLQNKFKNTPYASFSALMQAKYAVESGKLDLAKKKLQWVADNGNQSELRKIGKSRLTRLQ